jgi:hypothetical protein
MLREQVRLGCLGTDRRQIYDFLADSARMLQLQRERVVPGARIARRVYTDLACRWPHDPMAPIRNQAEVRITRSRPISAILTFMVRVTQPEFRIFFRLVKNFGQALLSRRNRFEERSLQTAIDLPGCFTP